MRSFGYTLDPTVINQEARDFFTCGQCWALAEVLTDDYGWPVVMEGDSWECEDWWVHALVKHPSGNLLDILGFTPHDDSRPYYDQSKSFVELAGDCWIGQEPCTDFVYYRRRSLSIAREFVPVLLDTYKLA